MIEKIIFEIKSIYRENECREFITKVLIDKLKRNNSIKKIIIKNIISQPPNNDRVLVRVNVIVNQYIYVADKLNDLYIPKSISVHMGNIQNSEVYFILNTIEGKES